MFHGVLDQSEGRIGRWMDGASRVHTGAYPKMTYNRAGVTTSAQSPHRLVFGFRTEVNLLRGTFGVLFVARS